MSASVALLSLALTLTAPFVAAFGHMKKGIEHPPFVFHEADDSSVTCPFTGVSGLEAYEKELMCVDESEDVTVDVLIATDFVGKEDIAYLITMNGMYMATLFETYAESLDETMIYRIATPYKDVARDICCSDAEYISDPCEDLVVIEETEEEWGMHFKACYDYFAPGMMPDLVQDMPCTGPAETPSVPYCIAECLASCSNSFSIEDPTDCNLAGYINQEAACCAAEQCHVSSTCTADVASSLMNEFESMQCGYDRKLRSSAAAPSKNKKSILDLPHFSNKIREQIKAARARAAEVRKARA